MDGPKPFDVRALSKGDHLNLDGGVKDKGALVEAIETIMRESPQLAALFDWESSVLRATGRTVSSILELAAAERKDKRAAEVGVILSWLAVEAVGAKNVETGRFRAVNEALLPILADRIAKFRSGAQEEDIWRAALEQTGGSPPLPLQKAARLNRLVHIAEAGKGSGTERGVVVRLPKRYREDFERCFGISEKDAAAREFCYNVDGENHRFWWVLVQCQAACDHAQANPGPLPFYLGLDFPARLKKGKRPPASTWRGPAFHRDDGARILRVSARFPVRCHEAMRRPPLRSIVCVNRY